MTLSTFDISGKTCLVVGGTSGLGQAVTLGLVQAGARVVAGSSNPAKVAAMKTLLIKIIDQFLRQQLLHPSAHGHRPPRSLVE